MVYSEISMGAKGITCLSNKGDIFFKKNSLERFAPTVHLVAPVIRYIFIVIWVILGELIYGLFEFFFSYKYF